LRCSLSQAKHRLFVGNVPKGLSEEELRNIIQGKGPGVVNIEMFKVCFLMVSLLLYFLNKGCRFFDRDFFSFRISMTQAVIEGSSLLSIITMLVQTMLGRNCRHQASRLMEAN
jgi:RNA recognition motif-containing protein